MTEAQELDPYATNRSKNQVRKIAKENGEIEIAQVLAHIRKTGQFFAKRSLLAKVKYFRRAELANS